LADDNVELGRFDLVGIPAATRGVPQIEVKFDIDRDGIVHVSAKDLGTGKEQKITISAPKKLSKEEIDKMVKDAEKFAADDAKKREEIETVNQADNLIYATEKSLKDYGDKVSPTERADIEAKSNDLKNAIKDKNVDRIKKGMEELTKVSHKLAEEIYKQANAKQQKSQDAAGQASSGAQQDTAEEPQKDAKKDEDIIDAEYKEEDQDGKKK
jgi:molecular chaperone DnaK